MSKQATTLLTLVLIILFVASAGTLIYSRWTRVRLLPSALRYLPPETDVLVGVGDISSSWDGMKFHFGRVFHETERNGFMATELADIRKKLEEKHLSIDRKEDLTCRYGVDIDRGVLVGMTLHDFAYAAVIPVASDEAAVKKHCPRSVAEQDAKTHTTSEKKLAGFFCSLYCSEGASPVLLRYRHETVDDPCNPSNLFAEGRKDRAWVVEDHAYALGDRTLIFPRPDTAILSRSCELLNRGLAEQERNLSFARADDALFEAVRYQLRRPLLSGPGALVYVRGLSNPTDFEPVGTVTASINLVPDAVVGDLRLRTAGANARVVEDLVATPKRERTWRQFFGADDAAVLVLRDDSLRRYMDLASNNPSFVAELKTFLGGILEPARHLDHLEQIVLGGTDYRDGLPILVLGIWGSRDELAQLVSTTQRRLLRSRDEKLREGARLQGVDAKIDPENFNGREYLETHGKYQIRYLEPPVTQEDLKYRLSVDPDEGRILLENRYRLASMITDDTLWVSTGRQQLVRMIDRLDGAKAPDGFPLGMERDGQGNKLRVLANVNSLIRKGMLSGESELQSLTEQFLLDFRYHREITVSLRPTGSGQELRLEFVAHGEPGSDAPVE